MRDEGRAELLAFLDEMRTFTKSSLWRRFIGRCRRAWTALRWRLVRRESASGFNRGDTISFNGEEQEIESVRGSVITLKSGITITHG